MARVRFEFDDRDMRSRIIGMDEKVNGYVRAVVDYNALRGEAHMKNTAPWHDDTGAARVGLHTSTGHTGNMHEIIFAHSVDYGIWLEIAHSGRYQVIMPSVRVTGGELMSSLRGMLGKI